MSTELLSSFDDALNQYKTALSNHDWYYSYSDDNRVYFAGQNNIKHLYKLAEENGIAFKIAVKSARFFLKRELFVIVNLITDIGIARIISINSSVGLSPKLLLNKSREITVGSSACNSLIICS